MPQNLVIVYLLVSMSSLEGDGWVDVFFISQVLQSPCSPVIGSHHHPLHEDRVDHLFSFVADVVFGCRSDNGVLGGRYSPTFLYYIFNSSMRRAVPMTRKWSAGVLAATWRGSFSWCSWVRLAGGIIGFSAVVPGSCKEDVVDADAVWYREMLRQFDVGDRCHTVERRVTHAPARQTLWKPAGRCDADSDTEQFATMSFTVFPPDSPGAGVLRWCAFHQTWLQLLQRRAVCRVLLRFLMWRWAVVPPDHCVTSSN